MAALRGTIRSDRSRVTRLSHHVLNVHADTWNTFAELELNADGSGTVRVRQNERQILTATWTAEDRDGADVEIVYAEKFASAEDLRR